ncbi:hypothetical [Yersinia pestis KIM10+]|uniref:Uncharacterized protein n=1 Tax=Yersinia pestis TaxID=632 RepID=Q8CL67_YERPE|nr:hypothetical [Yersinia pestis KIM10+]
MMVSVKGGKPCITLGLMSVRQRWIFVCWLMGWTVNEKQNHYPMASHRQRPS